MRRALEVSPESAMHVGDRLDHDALGANRCGMKGVWLDRTCTGTGRDDVIRINSLGQLDEFIAEDGR